jgi:hypothetical protein
VQETYFRAKTKPNESRDTNTPLILKEKNPHFFPELAEQKSVNYIFAAGINDKRLFGGARGAVVSGMLPRRAGTAGASASGHPASEICLNT